MRLWNHSGRPVRFRWPVDTMIDEMIVEDGRSCCFDANDVVTIAVYPAQPVALIRAALRELAGDPTDADIAAWLEKREAK